MIDVIKLLPDNVANQIAAGEVVQRPASAVKEMLENSIDAGATHIKLLIKEGGIGLIKVVDNGKGMSETDARLCWERHATSKIERAQDLYALKTFGFRGEALASIAAVARVEMITRRPTDNVACKIEIAGGDIENQELETAPVGTSIAVKNLFYNIPARRNFLKSAAVETKHIIEEFVRQALAYPAIEMEMYNNDNEVYRLRSSSLADRIIDLSVGLKKEDLLVVNETTDIVQISGFVGQPSKAKRTKGNQYFFVNNRFIRSNYFNHALQGAYEGLIDGGMYAPYFLFLQVDAAKIDVNIHPTKTDVKFEDEKHIYSILRSAVRKAVGNFVIQPNLGQGMDGIDELSALLNAQNRDSKWVDSNAGVPDGDRRYNPFETNYDKQKRHQDWAKILGGWDTPNLSMHHVEQELDMPAKPELPLHDEVARVQQVFMLKNGVLCAQVDGALVLVHAYRARKRLLYDQYMRCLEKEQAASQQLLFPRNMELSPALMAVFYEYQDLFKKIGFDLSHFGGNTLLVSGLPIEMQQVNEQELIETLLTDLSNAQADIKDTKNDFIAKSLSNNMAASKPMDMGIEEQKALVENLLRSSEPKFSPDGLPAMLAVSAEKMYDAFKKGTW